VSRGAALIVGAGIGGLAAGVALRRAGWPVQIFERAASPRDLGFALNLAPNAIVALRELGLADTVLSAGARLTAAELRRAGRVLRRVDIAASLSRRSTPSVVALRSVLHGALLEAVGSESLVLSSEAGRFSVEGDGVVLQLLDGRTFSGDILIGADGVGSTIRKQLHPGEPPPRRSGYCAVRGVSHEAGPHLGDLSALAVFGDGAESAAVRAGQGAVYWYLSLLAADAERMDTRDPKAIASRVAAGLDPQLQAIVRATRPDDLRIDELFDRPPIAQWGQGRVTLAGDAAHPMLPHTGQGAAQALEDAVAVGLALAADVPAAEALRRYERVRAARTRRIVQSGPRIARVTTTRNPAIAWVRDNAIRLMPIRPLLKAFLIDRAADPHRELRRQVRG
jgi:2-polyprenyl-6-methoxyphenol hydroxylase-like FAD-dependent oxidoreductase